MPIFASLVVFLMNALTTFYSGIVGMQMAVKYAAYVTLITVTVAFLGTTYICLTSLYSMVGGLVSGGGSTGGIPWMSYFFMGIGMFIPANAGAIVACIGSVWIATGVFKFQRDTIVSFAA